MASLLLRFGSRGNEVSLLQGALNQAPTQRSRLAVDGQFGLLTQYRVAEFQNDNQLKVDGIVGD